MWVLYLNAVTGSTANDNTQLDATISAGIGYTSDIFGIGVAYNYTWINKNLGVHTPVLMINALNDNLRIAVPVQIAVSDNLDKSGTTLNDRTDYMGVSTDIQIRYFTGIDAFNAVRLYVYYGQNGYKQNNQDYFSSSVGFQLRLYFLNTYINNVNVNPYLRIDYKTALEGGDWDVKSSDMNNIVKNANYDYNAYQFKIMPVLGLGASSDIVSVWFEPSLGYSVTGGGMKADGLNHQLAWGAYAELYITPVKDLEWYFEVDVNNYTYDGTAATPESWRQGSNMPVYFETTTGITWYLPSFGAAE